LVVAGSLVEAIVKEDSNERAKEFAFGSFD